MSENVDRRALAGFRCVDAITGLTIQRPLAVRKSPLSIQLNRSGVFAVMDAPGVSRAQTQTLFPASWPPPARYDITIEDAALEYLPRRASITVPQPLPAAAVPGTTTAASTTAAPATTPAASTTIAPGLLPVTTPQPVVMYPSAAARVAPNWAVIRVSVVSGGASPAPLPWTVIQVSGIAGMAPAGLSDTRGEALLAVPGLGLQFSSSSTGAVTEKAIAATVTAWFDPSWLGRPPGGVSNPDDILQNLSQPQWKSASQTVQLSPGQTSVVSFVISL